MATWFDVLFKDYHDRKQAMFAFSLDQVEAEGVTREEFRTQWTSYGSGLHLRKDIRAEFLARMERDSEAAKDALPTLHLIYVGERGMDHHTFRERDTGVYYCDTDYTPFDRIQADQPNLAVVEPPHWEPSYHVENRFVIVTPATAGLSKENPA